MSENDPYEVLGVEFDASEQAIKTAYRQRSLKVHPDRNPDNPDAARLFHELNQAYELLLDPLRKLAVDAKLRLKQARTQRFAAFDAKRKGMVAELEEREEAFKKAKMENRQREEERLKEEERIKEQGRRLREEKLQEWQKREDAMSKTDTEGEQMPPEIGSLDTTVRLKYTLAAHPELTTTASLSLLLSRFGPTDTETIQILLKPPKKSPDKPAKFVIAVVEFKQIGDAFAAVHASGRVEYGMTGIQIDWVEGKEPEILGWLKERGVLGGQCAKGKESPCPTGVLQEADEAKATKAERPQLQEKGDLSAFSSFPDSIPDFTPQHPDASGIDYESLTLMRLRQAERERLEREIRQLEQD